MRKRAEKYERQVFLCQSSFACIQFKTPTPCCPPNWSSVLRHTSTCMFCQLRPRYTSLRGRRWGQKCVSPQSVAEPLTACFSLAGRSLVRSDSNAATPATHAATHIREEKGVYLLWKERRMEKVKGGSGKDLIVTLFATRGHVILTLPRCFPLGFLCLRTKE